MLNINKNSRTICNRICIKIWIKKSQTWLLWKLFLSSLQSIALITPNTNSISTCFLLVVLVVSFRRMIKYLNTISLCAKCSSSWKFWICQLSKIKIHTSKLPYHIINMGYWPRLVGYWLDIGQVLYFFFWHIQESRQSPKCGPNLDTKFCREVFVRVLRLYANSDTPPFSMFLV